jgi:hypothetical protein
MASLRPQIPATPAHWSKDFVEHLRTVHLTIIVTAVALIIIALTTKPYNTAVASNELQKIYELKSAWSPDRIREMRDAQYEEVVKNRFLCAQVTFHRSGSEFVEFRLRDNLWVVDPDDLPSEFPTLVEFLRWWNA